jgi:hypothetical protein
MKTNKSDKKTVKTLPLSALSVVVLTDKDMSAVKGGVGWNS